MGRTLLLYKNLKSFKLSTSVYKIKFVRRGSKRSREKSRTDKT